MQLSRKAGFSLALLALSALAGGPAQAQRLYVGSNLYTGDNTQPGVVSVSAAGTAVSGNYTFQSNKPGGPGNVSSYSEIDTYNTSTASISGGTISDFEARDNSVVDVSGGSFDYLIGRNSSAISFAGGSATFLQGVSSGPVNVTGGTITSLDALAGLVTMSGGTAGSLYTSGNGIIDLLGSDLTETVIPVGNGMGAAYFTVQGTLQGSTSPFSVQYTAGNLNIYGYAYSTLEFNGVLAVPGAAPVNAPVPETSTTVSFGLLMLLGVGSLAVRRRKALS